MPTITEALAEILRGHGAGPFLFAGSGLSRRYLGLDDWSGLLKRFCVGIKPYEYYFSLSNGVLPAVAGAMAESFHEVWWSDEAYATSREKHQKNIVDKTGPLRAEICDYLKSVKSQNLDSSEYAREILALSKLNVDGIITTNWDTFLQDLFPDYKVYVGQDELLFSNPQSIGEIYKIHGCVNSPRSLILTDSDYHQFNERNAYLAAKLITIFVEHPVVFMGYSLTDDNVIGLLRAICSCVGQNKLSQLNNNLIFVQRASGAPEGVSQTVISLEMANIPITLIKTDNFVSVFEAIDSTKRKLPARVLRYCKEQLYELVKTTEPHGKLHVVDVDQVGGKKDIEFVVGLGVAAQKAAEESELVGSVGYTAITGEDLYREMLTGAGKYDPRRVLLEAVPRLSKGATYLPVFKFLRDAGVESFDDYKASGFDVHKQVNLTAANYKTQGLYKGFLRNYKDKTVQDLVAGYTPEIAAQYLPFLKWSDSDLPIICQFLNNNVDRFTSSSPYSTAFRKLACLYDRWVSGWE